MQGFESLLREVRACRLCEPGLPLGAKPVLQCSATARILIAGQAPGARVHASGIAFADASGERLRDWLGIDARDFYDPAQVAILPMGFCFPGSGASGDLPPRAECAPAWRARLLEHIPNIEMTLLLGRYAQAYHLPQAAQSVTENVAGWREHWPGVVPLPHPSPRNNRWLKQNPWFEDELLPLVKQRVAQLLNG